MRTYPILISAWLVVILAWVTPRPASAQDVSVRASVNESTIGEQEYLRYLIEIDGNSSLSINTPHPPEAEGLELMNAYPNTSRQVSIINGAMQQRVTYQWMYRPTGPGRALLASTTVQVGNQSFETEPIAVNVVPQSQRPGSPQARNPFRSQPDPQQEPEAQFTDRDLFIRALPSDRTVYQGEQVTIEYVLYFRRGIQLRQSRLADSWDADGFWREDLEVEFRPVPETVVESGIRYNRIVLKRAALFPTRPGELQVEPLRIETEAYAPYGSGDPFRGLFSFSRDFDVVEVTSPPVTINVRPLPAGAPASFSGAVGSFHMDTNVSRTSVEVGAPVEVEATITGSGNLSTFGPPRFAPPGTFERYDPQVNTRINRQGVRVEGSKTFTYVIVPRTNGRFELPPVAFTYFNPGTERYVTLASDPVTIQVTGTAPESFAFGAPPAAEMPVDDIAGIMTGDAAWTAAHPQPLHTKPWTYAALATPLALLGGLFLVQRRRARLATDVAFARTQQAHPAARKHLKRAGLLLREDRPKAFYAEVERAVLGFIGNRLNTPERGLTRQRLNSVLNEAGASAEVLTDLNRLLDECDQVRFAPVRPDHKAMQTAADRAARLIAAIDRLAVKAGAPAVS